MWLYRASELQMQDEARTEIMTRPIATCLCLFAHQRLPSSRLCLLLSGSSLGFLAHPQPSSCNQMEAFPTARLLRTYPIAFHAHHVGLSHQVSIHTTALCPIPIAAYCPTSFAALCHTPFAAHCPTIHAAYCLTPLAAYCPTPSTAYCPTSFAALCHTPFAAYCPTIFAAYCPIPSAAYCPTPSAAHYCCPASSLQRPNSSQLHPSLRGLHALPRTYRTALTAHSFPLGIPPIRLPRQGIRTRYRRYSNLRGPSRIPRTFSINLKL